MSETVNSDPKPDHEPITFGGIAAPRVHRVRLLPQELLDCGFFPEMIDPWGFLKRYLNAKKLPEWCLEDRTPVRTEVEADGTIVLEFGE